MHYFEYAEKDSTLYSRSGSQNTGIDEILEVVKDVVTDVDLIKEAGRQLSKHEDNLTVSTSTTGSYTSNIEGKSLQEHIVESDDVFQRLVGKYM